MTLSLLQNATAMATSLTIPFLATGGTPPYTYSVLPGGAGGSIDSNGLFTSPNITGLDTIQVVDSNNSVATASILVGNALELFCDVIQTGLALSQGQVYLWDQKINIPADYRLYIAVGVQTCKPFGNSNSWTGDGNQYQSTNFSATLSVDIFSRGPDARDRKEEVILALNSNYAEQQQELNSFRIFNIPTAFVNLSEVDGAAIPYRFNISVGLQYFVSKTSAVGYYSTFPATSVVPNP